MPDKAGHRQTTLKQNRNRERGTEIRDSLEGHRLLILAGDHAGEEGIGLGQIAGATRWAVSPDSSAAMLELHFESEFAPLLNPRRSLPETNIKVRPYFVPSVASCEMDRTARQESPPYHFCASCVFVAKIRPSAQLGTR